MCPDIQHPGITGCPVPELKKHVAAIDASLNSTDVNNPGLAVRFGLFVMQWKESEKERNIQTSRFRFWVMAGIGLLAALATIYDGLKATSRFSTISFNGLSSVLQLLRRSPEITSRPARPTR